MDRLALTLIALFAMVLPTIPARADMLADVLGWILGKPESTQPAGQFEHPDCPFTFKLPEGAKLDGEGVDVTKWQDGSRQVSALWRKGDLEVTLFCTPQADYRIPAGFVERICAGGNPLLVEGSACGPSAAFDGIEVYHPQQIPDGTVKYFWLYTGHKLNGGRIRLRVADTGAAALSETQRKGTSDVAKSLFATIK